MADRMDDLEAALRQLAPYLDLGPRNDLTASVMQQVHGSSATSRKRSFVSRYRIAIAVAAVLVGATAVLVLSTPAREAVADLLGIGGVRVEYSDRNATPGSGQTPDPAQLQLGRNVSLDRATELAGFQVRVPEALGAPDSVAYDGAVDGGLVSLMYRPRVDLPETGATGLGALLMQFPSHVDEPLVKKLVDEGVQVDHEEVGGVEAYWIRGPHALLFRHRGELREEAARLAADTLIWEVKGITYRLESELSVTDAIAVAESLR